MEKPVRILLADDHALFREGVRAVLARHSGNYEVVGEATTGEEAVRMTSKLCPDIVIMDLSMPETDGLEATLRVRSFDRNIRILVLTVHDEESHLRPALEAGASGYLTKTSVGSDLLEALEVLQRGDAYLPDRATTLLCEGYKGAGTAAGPSLSDLSNREKEVLALSAEGFSAREIGAKLEISSKTVETYRVRAMNKLDLDHRTEVIRFALKTGLLTVV